MLGEQRCATSTRSRTGSGARAAMPESAASSPRSSSTAGCRPRTKLAQLGRAPAWPRRAPRRCASRTRADGVGEDGPGHAEVHGQRDQPLLGAVVQVAFDPAAFGVGGGDELGPAAGQRLDPHRQLLGAAGAEQAPGRGRVGPGDAPAPPTARRAAGRRQPSQARPMRSRRTVARPTSAASTAPTSRARPARRRRPPSRGEQVVAELPPGGRGTPRPRDRPPRPAAGPAAGGAGISTPSRVRNRSRCRVPNPCTLQSSSDRPSERGRA